MYDIDKKLKKSILKFQRNEMTEYCIYSRLPKKIKGNNSKIFKQIAADEMKHYNVFKNHTGVDVKPKYFQVWFYVFVSKILGITFGIKLMEKA